AEALGHAFGDLVHRLRIAHVEDVVRHLAPDAGAAQFLLRALEVLLLARGDDHVGAAAAERLGDREADPRGAAGDDRRPSREVFRFHARLLARWKPSRYFERPWKAPPPSHRGRCGRCTRTCWPGTDAPPGTCRGAGPETPTASG